MNENLYLMRTSDPLFEETQYFRQVWLWVILIASMVFAAIIPWTVKSNTDPVSTKIAVVLVTIFVLVWFFIIRLQTRITEEGILYRFYPLMIKYRYIGFGEIEKIEVIQYRPLLDYGGWGMKWGFKGKAYNVSGNMGMMITFKNGKHLMLGTNRAEELKGILQQIKVG